MLESIKEQKVSLAAYSAQHSNIPQLSTHQLSIIDKVITLLKPVDDITRLVSCELASASMIIPFVRVLSRSWEIFDDDQGVRTMKEALLSSLRKRFAEVE